MIPAGRACGFVPTTVFAFAAAVELRTGNVRTVPISARVGARGGLAGFNSGFRPREPVPGADAGVSLGTRTVGSMLSGGTSLRTSVVEPSLKEWPEVRICHFALPRSSKATRPEVSPGCRPVSASDVRTVGVNRVEAVSFLRMDTAAMLAKSVRDCNLTPPRQLIPCHWPGSIL
jgi:hypothetical protein